MKTRTHAPGRPVTESAVIPSHSGVLQRKCGCGGSAGLAGECESCRRKKMSGMQMKLAVNQPGDSYEQEADRVADQVMRMRNAGDRQPGPAPVTQAPAQAISRYPQGDGGGADAPAIVHDVVNSSGQPLDAATRTFMESRFGHDFGRVRVHTDGQAAESARTVNALAYTVGSNVVFGEGRYAPGTESGRRLLAHELVHTVQQGGSGDTAGPVARAVQRTVVVDNPAGMIPNPGGGGVTQSNADTVRDYLTTICAGGSVAVDATSGVVSVSAGFCSPIAIGGLPLPWLIPAAMSTTPTGCGCLCDLVHSPNRWVIQVDDGSWPHTVFDNNDGASGITPGGTGGTVTAPSPNSTKLWGAGAVSGRALDIDPWLVLGHELCGHAWLGNAGRHGPDHAQNRGEGGHQETVARENLLRQEHGIELRATFREPNCGESYWRSRSSPGRVHWSQYRDVCRRWRRQYNRTHGTSFTITDTIP